MVRVKIDDGHQQAGLRDALDQAGYAAATIVEDEGRLWLEVPDGLDALSLDLFAQRERRRAAAQKIKDVLLDPEAAAALDALL